MSSIRNALMLGVALFLGSAAGVQAADLYGGGSIKDTGYLPAPAPAPSMYFRLDGGYTRFDKPGMVEDGYYDFTNTHLDNTYSLGGGVGMYFTRNIRGDITYTHLFNADAGGHLQDCCAPMPGVRDFKFKSDVVLANLYYDFNAGGRFSPYIGAGLGYAWNKTSAGTITPDPCACTGPGTMDAGSSGHVAAALMAGMTWKLTGRPTPVGSTKDGVVMADSGRGLYLDAGYRFLYLGKVSTGPDRDALGVVVGRDPVVEDIHAHEFRVGLRYDFR